MKHHCHCGFREHFKLFRARKIGFLGGAFLFLHLLFHVAECFILPSILVGLGGHLAEEPVAAASGEQVVIEDKPEKNYAQLYDFIKPEVEPLDNTDFYNILP